MPSWILRKFFYDILNISFKFRRQKYFECVGYLNETEQNLDGYGEYNQRALDSISLIFGLENLLGIIIICCQNLTIIYIRRRRIIIDRPKVRSQV